MQTPVYRSVIVGRGLGPAVQIPSIFTTAASRRPTLACGIQIDKLEFAVLLREDGQRGFFAVWVTLPKKREKFPIITEKGITFSGNLGFT